MEPARPKRKLREGAHWNNDGLTADVEADLDASIKDVVHAAFVDARKARGGGLVWEASERHPARPRDYGLCVVTRWGAVHGHGDVATPFNLRSLAEPFVYALALSDFGVREVEFLTGLVADGCGVDTADIDQGRSRQRDPLSRADGLITTSLFLRDGMASGTVRIQSQMVVTATDLAMMAATLASGGKNPVTGLRVVTPNVAARVMTFLATSGMGVASDERFTEIGLPAMGDAFGGLCATAPGLLGIGVLSPLVGGQGRSARGRAACSALSARLGLHSMQLRLPW